MFSENEESATDSYRVPGFATNLEPLSQTALVCALWSCFELQPSQHFHPDIPGINTEQAQSEIRT